MRIKPFDERFKKPLWERSRRSLLCSLLCGIFLFSTLPSPLLAQNQSGVVDATTGASAAGEPLDDISPTTGTTVYKNQIISESALLMDADSGQILFEKNMHKQLAPASITKILTALLAVEKGDFNDTITMSHDAVFSVPRGASHIALDEGEQLTLEQAMYAMMLPSANDAANGIAEYLSGSVIDFAALMNQRAKELGALDSHFVNANGLSAQGHYTSAYDMALITREALKYEKFRTVWGTARYDMAPTNLQPEVRIFNTQNKMLTNTKYHYDGVVGGKLGYTSEADNTMVVVAQRNGRTLICVLLKTVSAADKYADAQLLFDDGFTHYRPVLLKDLKPVGSMTFLLHSSLQPGQIAQTYSNIIHNPDGSSQVQIDFSLIGTDRQIMYPELGSLTLSTEPQVSSGTRWQALIMRLLAGFLVLIIALFLILFSLAAYFRTRRRFRRARKKRRAPQAMRLRSPQKTE